MGESLITTSLLACPNGSVTLPLTRTSICGSGMPTALHATEISLSCRSEQYSVDEFKSESNIILVLVELLIIGSVGHTNMGGTV